MVSSLLWLADYSSVWGWLVFVWVAGQLWVLLFRCSGFLLYCWFHHDCVVFSIVCWCSSTLCPYSRWFRSTSCCGCTPACQMVLISFLLFGTGIAMDASSYSSYALGEYTRQVCLAWFLVMLLMESLLKVGLVCSLRICWYSNDVSSAIVISKLSLMSLPRY